MVRNIIGKDAAAKQFYDVAYAMSMDLYKTFAPIKHTSHTVVLAMVELTALISEYGVEQVQRINPAEYHTSRGAVVETMLDLLDLFIQHHKMTKLGALFDHSKFIDVKIKINSEVESNRRLSRYEKACEMCEAAAMSEATRDKPPTPASAGPSPATTSSIPGSSSVKRVHGETLRFVFDASQARQESQAIDRYHKEEFEDYEVEEEVPIVEPERNHRADRGSLGWHRGRSGHHYDRGRGSRRFH